MTADHQPANVNLVFYALAVFAVLVLLATLKWGLVVLSMVALALVPVVFAGFLVITRG